MKSSGNSSAPSPPSRSGDTPTRSRFALTGRSRTYDPRTTAARPDIADVRLAATIFAPHYAAPMSRAVVDDAPLFGDRRCSEEIGRVSAGEQFEILEIAAGIAWGISRGDGTVGYVALAALAAA